MEQEILNRDREEIVKNDLLVADEGTDIDGRIELKLTLMQDMSKIEARFTVFMASPTRLLRYFNFVTKRQEVNQG